MILAAALAAAMVADAPPLRHLVYSFTYESRQHGAVSNDPGTSGASSYTGKLDDRGTMTVDVLREAPDRGLVLVVSEQGEGARRSAAATCAVYGNTTVICDKSKPMNSEEFTLLRFLGVNFFDPTLLDTKQHWSVGQQKDRLKMNADYVISSGTDPMTIQETRHVEDTSTGSITVDTQTKLIYSFKRLLPLEIDEYATEEQHSGVIGVSSTTYQTTFNLVSDSMAKPQS
jgi:hypothetical protein